MQQGEVRVSWRAAVLLRDGSPAIYGHLCRVGLSRAVVRMDHNLAVGQRCALVMLLPKKDADEPSRFVEADCTISHVLHSRMQFHLTLEWQALKGDGADLLQERLGMHSQMWLAAR